jgi:hypothetical protein
MGEALVKSSRRTIPVTCTTHGGGRNFCNLLMTKESDGTIVLDPHVANCCVLRLDYAAATAVFDTLGKWLDDRRLSHARAVTPWWLEFCGRVCHTALVAHHLGSVIIVERVG